MAEYSRLLNSIFGLLYSLVFFLSVEGPQIQALRQGAEVVVATPGRCNDLLEMGYLDISQVSGGREGESFG